MFTVVQQTETGEEFGVQQFSSYEYAYNWILQNMENFPESIFRIES